jgi:ABC-2 type transport system permease protein
MSGNIYMKILTLAKKESQDILNNKIYLLVIFVQLFIVLGAFGLAIISSIATDPALLDTYGITSHLNVGISEDLNGSQLDQDLKAQNFNVIYYNNSGKDLNLLRSGLVASVGISPDGQITVQTDNSNVFYPVISQKIDTAVNEFELTKKLESAGLNQSEIQTIQNPVTLTEIKVNGNKTAPIALDSSYFVEVMYGFIVPFVLLLPFFMASNIVTDSVVGERERKTFEVLLMTPLSSSTVMIGKILPILLFSILQSMAWILILDLLKVPIYNPIILFVILSFVGLGFIGVGIIISMLVDSTKEANSAITLALLFATFILFVPLFIKAPLFEGILNFLPTVLIIKLSSTPIVGSEILLSSIPTIILSAGIFLLAIRYFRHERAIRL